MVIEKFGIDKLLEKSFQKIEGAVKSACFHSIREQIRTNYEIKIRKIQEWLNNEYLNVLITICFLESWNENSDDK